MNDYIDRILAKLNFTFDPNKKTICVGYDN